MSKPSDWGDYEKFVAWYRHAAAWAQYFAADELLILGAGHNNPASAGYRLNAYPPPTLWRNVLAVLHVVNAVRGELGEPVTITSAYRTRRYNLALPGAARNSRHCYFRALDVRARMVDNATVAMLASEEMARRKWRGYVQAYDGHVHVHVE